jgi:hypothetical protein
VEAGQPLHEFRAIDADALEDVGEALFGGDFPAFAVAGAAQLAVRLAGARAEALEVEIRVWSGAPDSSRSTRVSKRSKLTARIGIARG